MSMQGKTLVGLDVQAAQTHAAVLDTVSGALCVKKLSGRARGGGVVARGAWARRSGGVSQRVSDPGPGFIDHEEYRHDPDRERGHDEDRSLATSEDHHDREHEPFQTRLGRRRFVRWNPPQK